MSDERKHVPYSARFSGSLALWIMGLLAANASTYPCPMRNDLGVHGCLFVGELLLGCAAVIFGFTCGKQVAIREVKKPPA
jgi:hypothetical protein